MEWLGWFNEKSIWGALYRNVQNEQASSACVNALSFFRATCPGSGKVKQWVGRRGFPVAQPGWVAAWGYVCSRIPLLCRMRLFITLRSLMGHKLPSEGLVKLSYGDLKSP